MSKSIEILEKLISFDTTISVDTLEAVMYVKKYLEENGAKTRLVYNENKTRASLLATVGDENKAGIVLSGHLDTVSSIKEEWNTDPYKLTEIDGMLYGRGASDMKGGISCALGNIEHLKNSGETFHFALTHDEEGIFSAVKQLNRTNFDNFFKQKPVGCMVMEPTMLKPIYGHKGTYLAKINVVGKESHSAYPYLGVDALSYAVRIYNEIREIYINASKGFAIDNDYNPNKTTLNVCTFNSGDAINKIPGYAELSYCMRYLPQDDIGIINSAVKDFCGRMNEGIRKEDAGCGVVFTEILDVKGFESDKNSEFIKYLDNPAKVSYGTEGGFFMDLGINTIVFGPGSIEQAHVKNEFIDKKQIAEFDDFIKNKLCKIKF